MSDATRASLIETLVEAYQDAAACADALGKERDVLETALDEKTEESRAAEDLRDDLEQAIKDLGGDLPHLLRELETR